MMEVEGHTMRREKEWQGEREGVYRRMYQSKK